VKGIVFSSTAAVYGTPQRIPVFETDPTEPESPYGWSKLMSERMLQDVAAATNLKYMILRYFNVAGAEPRQRLGQRTRNATHLIKVACEAAAGKRPSVAIFGDDYDTRDGTCIRDYIHIEDLADAHVKALGYLGGGGESQILNCGYSRGSTVKEVIDAVREVSGVNFKVERGPRRPGDVVEVVAGATRIKSVLGWQPQLQDLRTIVEHAYKFERLLP
jgi:UDP-glucose 4-epimerase